MNRQHLESGYPEQHAYDDRRRESDANAGNEHHRGEYRAGRYGRTEYGASPEEFGQRRQDWYRSDQYRGYRDDDRSRDSRQGEQWGPGFRSDRGYGVPFSGFDPSMGGYGANRQGYAQAGNQSSAGWGSSVQSARDRGFGGYVDRIDESGYMGSRAGDGEGGFSSWNERSYGPRSGHPGAGQYGYPSPSWSTDDSQRGAAPSQYGYGAQGFGMRMYGPSSGPTGYGQSAYEHTGTRPSGENLAPRSRAGRTPKGYTRSDERIREDVNDRLMQANGLDPSEIEVRVERGEVKLTGSVESRHEKFLAEQLAESVSGVKDIVNQLRVQRFEAGSKSDAQLEQKRGGGSLTSTDSSAAGSSSTSSRTSSGSGASR